MTNAEFREVLEDRTAQYAVEVFKYLRERPYDVSTKVIAHQLGKSASSIGANYHEANRSESCDDFVHKVAIAVKEANESCYWFKVHCEIMKFHWFKTSSSSIILRCLLNGKNSRIKDFMVRRITVMTPNRRTHTSTTSLKPLYLLGAA